MTVPRIYSPESLENKNSCALGEDNVKYLKKVMRLKEGDRIHIFDGFGREYEATIKNFSAKSVLVDLGKAIPSVNRDISITLAQAITKGKKWTRSLKAPPNWERT